MVCANCTLSFIVHGALNTSEWFGHGKTWNTAVYKDRSVNQDEMLADVESLTAGAHRRMAHAGPYVRQAAAAATVPLHTSRSTRVHFYST